MLVYKMDILKALNAHGYNTGRIARNAIFGPADVQKMRENVVLGITGIEKLCLYLETQPGNIFRMIPDDEYDALKKAGALKPYEIVSDRYSENRKRITKITAD